MSDPGWSNDWWGRDPIEQAQDEPKSEEEQIEEYELRTQIIKNQTELLAMLIKGMRQ